jgi:L-rhamnono-1,4-lactonase
VFEIGADIHRQGEGQIQEVVEMVERAHHGVAESEKTVFILGKEGAILCVFSSMCM